MTGGCEQGRRCIRTDWWPKWSVLELCDGGRSGGGGARALGVEVGLDEPGWECMEPSGK